jgi:hypothetical protein
MYVCVYIYVYICKMAVGNFVDWRQCAAVMKRVAFTFKTFCGGGNVVWRDLHPSNRR